MANALTSAIGRAISLLFLLALIEPANADQMYLYKSGACSLSLKFSTVDGPRGPELRASRTTEGPCSSDLVWEASAVRSLLAEAKTERVDLRQLTGLFWAPMDEKQVLVRAVAANLSVKGSHKLDEPQFARLLQSTDSYRELRLAFKQFGVNLIVEGTEEVGYYSKAELLGLGVPSDLLVHQRGRITARAQMLWFKTVPLD